MFFKAIKWLKHPLIILIYILRRPLKIGWRILFKLVVFPTYKLYLRLKLEAISGRGIRSILYNSQTFHVIVVIFILILSARIVAGRTFAAPDLASHNLLASFLNKNNEVSEFLVEEGSISAGELGYIPLGFADLDEDDEEIFALISGGGAFLRPLNPSSQETQTRLGIETYIVQKGDTVSSIANQFGISINTILWSNNLTARSFLREGQKLTILPTTGVTHTVKKGDTISSIASKYKGSAEQILAFNNLATGLQVGQVIIVPDGRIPPPPPPPARPRTPAFVPQAIPGKMFWPVGNRRITQYYWLRHPALDIGTPVGTPVYAAEAGIVEFVKFGRTGYGYQLMINHGGGIRTRYAHNSQILVKAGEQVQKGQVVSFSGNTGRSTGPHLHFEIFIGSRRVNPLQYIR